MEKNLLDGQTVHVDYNDADHDFTDFEVFLEGEEYWERLILARDGGYLRIYHSPEEGWKSVPGELPDGLRAEDHKEIAQWLLNEVIDHLNTCIDWNQL